MRILKIISVILIILCSYFSGVLIGQAIREINQSLYMLGCIDVVVALGDAVVAYILLQNL